MPLGIRFVVLSISISDVILIPTFLRSHSLPHLSVVFLHRPLLWPHWISFFAELLNDTMGQLCPMPLGIRFVVLSISIRDFVSHFPVLSFSPSSFHRFPPPTLHWLSQNFSPFHFIFHHFFTIDISFYTLAIYFTLSRISSISARLAWANTPVSVPALRWALSFFILFYSEWVSRKRPLLIYSFFC